MGIVIAWIWSFAILDTNALQKSFADLTCLLDYLHSLDLYLSLLQHTIGT